jgi:hypothetical protein
MEQSPSLEANRFSTSEEILRILRNPKIHHFIHIMWVYNTVYHNFYFHCLLRVFTMYIKLRVSAPVMSNLQACTRSLYTQLSAKTKDGNKSIPELVKRPNPWRKMMMIKLRDLVFYPYAF